MSPKTHPPALPQPEILLPAAYLASATLTEVLDTLDEETASTLAAVFWPLLYLAEIWQALTCPAA